MSIIQLNNHFDVVIYLCGDVGMDTTMRDDEQGLTFYAPEATQVSKDCYHKTPVTTVLEADKK